MTDETDEDDCPGCRLFVGIGMALDFCEEVLGHKCSQLKSDIRDGKMDLEQFIADNNMTPLQFMDEIKKKVSEDDADIIDGIEEAMGLK